MESPGQAAPDNGDRFEIELTDLDRADVLSDASVPAPRSPLATRLTPRGRAMRLGSAIVGLALAVAITLGSTALGGSARTLLAGLAPSPASQPTANSRFVFHAGPTPIHQWSLPPTGDFGLWAALGQRPLHLPVVAPGSPCPASPGRVFSSGFGAGLGGDEVYAMAPGADDGALRYVDGTRFAGGGSDWGGQVVLWAISLSYGGPVLIRGRQLDGPNQLSFNGGLDEPGVIDQAITDPLLPSLRLLPADNGAGLPWGTSLAYTRVRAPGCYAYQIDGLGFSDVVVFQAVPDA